MNPPLMVFIHRHKTMFFSVFCVFELRFGWESAFVCAQEYGFIEPSVSPKSIAFPNSPTHSAQRTDKEFLFSWQIFAWIMRWSFSLVSRYRFLITQRALHWVTTTTSMEKRKCVAWEENEASERMKKKHFSPNVLHYLL